MIPMNKKLLHERLKANRKRIGETSPLAFAKIYLDNHCECKFSRLHLHTEMFQYLEQATNKRKARIAIAAPRGHAKARLLV